MLGGGAIVEPVRPRRADTFASPAVHVARDLYILMHSQEEVHGMGVLMGSKNLAYCYIFVNLRN